MHLTIDPVNSVLTVIRANVDWRLFTEPAHAIIFTCIIIFNLATETTSPILFPVLFSHSTFIYYVHTNTSLYLNYLYCYLSPTGM